MSLVAIKKGKEKSRPNLEDYEQFCKTFSWKAARSELDGLPEAAV